jgi:predicted TIM-barrel fold metal-dependent hydrolase
LEKLEVPFDLYVVPGSLCHVATIAEKFPKLKMVIDHIGKPKVQVRKWLMVSFLKSSDIRYKFKEATAVGRNKHDI